jgi:hypothetical protein
VSESTVKCPADIVTAFGFNRNVLRQMDDNYSQCISYSASKLGTVELKIASLTCPKKKKNSRGVKSGERGGQMLGPPLSVCFHGNLRSALFLSGNVAHSVLLEHHVQHGHEEFLYSIRHFNCDCSASGGKIWKLEWHELQI